MNLILPLYQGYIRADLCELLTANCPQCNTTGGGGVRLQGKKNNLLSLLDKDELIQRNVGDCVCDYLFTGVPRPTVVKLQAATHMHMSHSQVSHLAKYQQFELINIRITT